MQFGQISELVDYSTTIPDVLQSPARSLSHVVPPSLPLPPWICMSKENQDILEDKIVSMSYEGDQQYRVCWLGKTNTKLLMVSGREARPAQ